MFKLAKRLTICLIIPFIFACGGKDDEGMNNAAELIGTWSFEAYFFDMTIDGKEAIDYFVEDLDYTEKQAEEFKAFFSELSEINVEELGTITFESSGEYVVTASDGNDLGAWSLNGDASELTLDAGTEDRVVLRVNTLSSGKLSLTQSDTMNEDLNDDDASEEITLEVMINLKKQ